MISINNTTKQKVNLKRAEILAESFLMIYKKCFPAGFEVSIAVIGAGKMKTFNYQYRGLDKTTDVLSFSLSKTSGEILINLEETRRPKKYQEIFGQLVSAKIIFDFLLIHGLLHLAGYEDKTEKGRREMIARGLKFLNLK